MPPPGDAAKPAETVSVRMYRGLLGDCFLLTHSRGEGDDREDYFALIDCGVLQCIGDRPLTKAALARLPKVVADLKARTGGRLDLVVATHEHYDHLSGFLIENDVFREFDIRRLWVGWTESRTDPLANDIRARGKKALSLLKALATPQALALAGDDPVARDRLATIETLLQFYDDDIEPWSPDDAFAAAKPPRPYDPATQKPRSCANAIEWLRHRAGETNVRYLEPGEVVAFGLDDRLRTYVLGPPRTGSRLLQLNPSSGAQREVYLTTSDEVETLATILRSRRLGLAEGAHAAPARLGAADQPFAHRHHRTGADLKACAIAGLYYADDGVSKARRIDGEWLGAAELLALKIDSDVNNTSLVLAVETPGQDRPVLLFPADAQVGNWLSWHDQRYPAAAPPEDPAQTAAEILSRVVLYKVGHHGSHNATAREKGLELMTSPHLAAMIPVVSAVAGEQTTSNNPDGWAMPYDHLYERLEEKTAGRIVRGDGDLAQERAAFAAGVFAVSYADDDGADPLWVELALPVTGA